MADRKPCTRRIAMVALAGSLCMSSASTNGQPAKEPPPPTPPAAIEVRTFLGGLNDKNRFNFVIQPDTPLKDLLPIPPKAKQPAPRLVDDISQVPEVAFQEPLAKSPEALKLTAHTMAKINFLNKVVPLGQGQPHSSDGFMEALLQERPDLADLPMAMGEDCRTKGDRSKFFTQALNTIKQARVKNNVVAANQVRASKLRALADNQLKVQKAIAETIGQVGSSIPSPAPSEKNTSAAIAATLPPGQQPMFSGNIDIVGDIIVSAGSAHQTVDPDAFWDQFTKLCAQEDKANSRLDPNQLDHVTCARIAALMQVLGPESVAMRKGLVKYLAATSHPEATRALVKLAVFSSEDEVRNPAIDALKVRREKDYTPILLQGLRYPLPAVAKRATEAMTKLERTDLVPELVSFLEEADPRAPRLKEVGEKKVPVIRELVRINHHRNCLMCHSPAVPTEVPAHVTTAEVPRPDQPLPFPSDGYQNSNPNVLVRLDVTYLRQDFSLLQPVADANPWPEMQRFDFLVRNRVITDEEAKVFPAAKLGMLSPYQRYALAALRELTGRDAAPTPEAWRKLLDLPARRSL
jgi:hypothetical protein